MGQAVVDWGFHSSRQSLLRSSAILAGAMLLLALLILPVAYWQQGTQGLVEAAGAVLLCLLPSMAALALGHMLLGTKHGLFAILGGIALRMFPPMSVCLLLAFHGGGQQWLQFITYLLISYMVALAVETSLSVGLLKERQPTDDSGQ